jgi:hypothetical protein
MLAGMGKVEKMGVCKKTIYIHPAAPEKLNYLLFKKIRMIGMSFSSTIMDAVFRIFRSGHAGLRILNSTPSLKRRLYGPMYKSYRRICFHRGAFSLLRHDVLCQVSQDESSGGC